MRRALVPAIFLTLIAGCGGGSGGSVSSNPDTSPTATVQLMPFQEPWTLARYRQMDIDDNAYAGAFYQAYSYANARVTVTYQTDPANGYFVGHIEGSGLKPNFAYQLKLAGKPVSGSRGWGAFGDDRASEAIGRAARWWNDSLQANSTDSDFNRLYDNAPANQRQTIYGYQFMGDVVTDAEGNVSANFDGSKALHITWQDKQNQHRDVDAGTFTIGSQTAPYYGYGQSVPVKNIKLWYEWQSGRSHAVRLPSGTYNVRFLITEESFHSGLTLGGQWRTVLANEDFSGGQPDTNAANDVVFRIR